MANTNEAQNIFEKGCLVILNVSQYTGTMRIDKKTVKEKMNSEQVRANKKVLPKKALKDIQSYVSNTRAWLKSNSLPFPINASVFVPFEMIEDIDQVLTAKQSEFNALVRILSDNYQDYIAEIKPELEAAELFNTNDYPSNIEDKFSFSWKFVTLNTPSGEGSVLSPDFVKREQAKFQDTLNEAKELAISAIRQQFYEIVEHAVNKLTVKEGEQKKMFKSTTIEKFTEFFDTFNKRNCFGDVELQKVVENAKEIMEGVTAGDLRDDDEFRSVIAECLSDVKTDMDLGVIGKGRKLNMD